jgi:hypothetical protein
MSLYPFLSLCNIDHVMIGLTRRECSDMDPQKVFDPFRNAWDLLQAIDPANVSNGHATYAALSRSHAVTLQYVPPQVLMSLSGHLRQALRVRVWQQG